MIKICKNLKSCISKIFPQYKGQIELIDTQQEVYDKIKADQKPFVLIVNSPIIRNSKKMTDFLIEFKYPQAQNQLQDQSQQKLLESDNENTQQDIQDIDYFYYEPQNLQAAKDFFNMNKLPCAFLFNRGMLIDGEVGQEQAQRFFDCYNRLKTFHVQISQQQIKELIGELQIQIFEKKKYQNSIKKLNVVLEQQQEDQDKFLLQLLQSYCHFQLKNFIEFRQIWSKMNHSLVKNIEGEENILLLNLHQKFLHLWVNQIVDIKNFDELEQKCQEMIDQKNWEKVWNFVQIYEFIDTNKYLYQQQEFLNIQRQINRTYQQS